MWYGNHGKGDKRRTHNTKSVVFTFVARAGNDEFIIQFSTKTRSLFIAEAW